MRQPLSLRLAIRSAILFMVCFLILAFTGHMTRLYAQSIDTVAFLGIAVSGVISLWGLTSGVIEVFNRRERRRSILGIVINLCLLAMVAWRLLLFLSALPGV